ncbi:uncharacterized protein A4U43_C01F14860 [Asparagus officinalis]|uniref:Uncharacterized protein n=1 Tax=Asparagus officinalis TaxID=4686 RepID=A0A5P1FPE4_ASPOF|nr:uncharacterized protein A4U43_C01F14860 [Asparagus officinalis]
MAHFVRNFILKIEIVKRVKRVEIQMQHFMIIALQKECPKFHSYLGLSKLQHLDMVLSKILCQKNPRLKDYVNKPLKHYDDLKLIIGDDFVTGEFKKNAYDNFEGVANEVIDLDLPVENDSSPIQVGSSTEVKANKMKNAKTKVRIDKSSRANKRRLVRNEDSEEMTSFLEKVREIACAIKEGNQHYSVKLAESIYSLREFPQHVLDHALDHLYDNEKQARLFIVKPLESQVAWMKDHVLKYHLDNNRNVGDDIDEDSS